MTFEPCQPNQPPRSPNATLHASEQLDLLISRITDGEAHDQDWSAFEQLASREPEAWKQLALSQRQQAELGLAVGVALHAADRSTLPALSKSDADDFSIQSAHPLARLRAWGGWAIAACVALAWFGTGGLGNRLGVVRQGDDASRSFTAGLSADQLARAYLTTGKKEGRVYGEIPERLLLDAQPVDSGRGYEVVYIRQFVERAQVKDLMRFGVDESGNRIPVPVSSPVRLTDPQ